MKAPKTKRPFQPDVWFFAAWVMLAAGAVMGFAALRIARADTPRR